MVVISRYLRREVYTTTALVVVALLALFALFDLIGELDEMGEGAYRLRDMFLFVVLNVPGHLYEVLPVAALIGTTFALTQMAQQSEYTVIRASGVSAWRMALVLVRAGVTLALIGVLVGEALAPVSERAAQALRLQAKSAVVAQEFRSGLWVKDGNSFINVSQVTPEPRLIGLRVYEFDAAWRLTRVWFAREGRYLGDNRWQMDDVNETRFEGDRAIVERAAAREWTSVLTPSLLTVLLVKPDEMSAVSLWQYVLHLRGSQQAASRYEIALWRKAAYPLGIVVMLVLALPFAQQARRASAGPRIFAGIMLGLAFFFLNTLASHAGWLYDWPPPLAALLAPVSFLAVALGLVAYFERR
ncbi:MAG: LPS export ABC transporter permease LptG [Burkholderiales bacterium]|nr:LPS export ABC transporter permease LptG [Burkholderiales bacterium]